MLSEVLKSCKKMISPDRKTDVKQEIKELVAPSSLYVKNRGWGVEVFT